MKEAENSSPIDHTSTLFLGEFLIPKQVMRGRRFLPMHIYSSTSFHHSQWIQQSRLLVHISSGSWTCKIVEKGRDSDREKEQGQPEARGSPKKVEKEVKKIRRTSHPEKFEASAPNGHHKDYILLLFVGLACKSTLACLFVCLFFFFFFHSNSMIVSHSPFACKWKNKFWDSGCLFPEQQRWDYGHTNPTQLFGVTPYPMYEWCVSCAWVGPEPYIKTKCFVSYSFNSISETHKSKEGHL